MQALSAADILRICELGQDQHPLYQGLLFLAVAHPGSSWDALARLPVGQRDARLYELYAISFGRKLEGFAECPACRERLEFTLDALELTGSSRHPVAERQELEIDGLRLRFRLPDSIDLACAARTGELDAARRLLATRLVLEADRDGIPVDPGSLSDPVLQALGARLAEADPQAEVVLSLECPACGHAWQSALDIVRFLWAQTTSRARRLVEEVHLLARAYGWREADVLAMSDWRRRLYLERVGG